jgi:hypothetical protein
MKSLKKFTVLVFLLSLSGVTSVLLVPVAANPFFIEVSPPAGANLSVTISSPAKNQSYSNGTINLYFVVNCNGPSVSSPTAYYQGDWMQDGQYIAPTQTTSSIGHYSQQYNLKISDVPFGEHSLRIHTRGDGSYTAGASSPKYVFNFETYASVNFSVRTNPTILYPPIQNATFRTSTVSLNVTIDHPVELTYCLDNQSQMPMKGNITLTGLTNGQHKVTVYATDASGTDTSETSVFNVEAKDPLPSIPVIAIVSVIVVTAGACIGILGFKKKQKNNL